MLHGTQLLTQRRCAKSRAKSWIVYHHLYVIENLWGFINMLILWRLGRNCRAGRRFYWDHFAICLQIACEFEETSLLYNLYGRTFNATFSLKVTSNCAQNAHNTQVYGEVKVGKLYFYNNSSILRFLRNK